MLFWKQFGLVIQIAIVVAVVLAFSFFDPFGLLKSKKLKLEDTPINVQSIREIGQLITAEYYGEVLNSLQQSRIAQVMDNNDSFIEDYKILHDQFQNAITTLIDEKNQIKLTGWNKKKDLYDYFYHRFSILTENAYYQDYINWLLSKMGIKDEKRLLKVLFDQKEDETKKYKEIIKQDLVATELKKITNERINSLSANKKFKKQQIVVLGRGWVKAGIDFGEFTQQNFKYDKANKTIHLIGIKPEILVCTINPWFIPEKQVKGFEVILVSRKANEPKYMQMVKEETLKKLRSNALEANILTQARKNAETNLKDFFSLLIEDGVDQVVIHDSFFSYFDASMSSDVLDPSAMKTIDSLFVQRFAKDSLEVVAMRDLLVANQKITVGVDTFNIQRHSSLLSLIEDEELTQEELMQLEVLQQRIHTDRQYLANDSSNIVSFPLSLNLLDTIWYYPDKITRKSMDEMLKKEKYTIPEKKFSIRKILRGDPEFIAWDAAGAERVRRDIYGYMLDQKQRDLEMIIDQIKGSVAQYVSNDTTFVNKRKYAFSNDQRDTLIDSQQIIYIDGINKKINSELSQRTHTLMTVSEVDSLEGQLLDNMDWQKPYLINELRDSMRNENVLCLTGDCYPMSRYLRVLASTNSDISSADKSLKLMDKEDSLTGLNISDLWETDDQQIYLNAKDSLWYFPTLLQVEDFKKIRDEKYPEKKFSGFFSNIFNKKEQRKWLIERDQFVEKSVYKYMLDKKLEEVRQTKLNLKKEIEFLEIKEPPI